MKLFFISVILFPILAFGAAPTTQKDQIQPSSTTVEAILAKIPANISPDKSDANGVLAQLRERWIKKNVTNSSVKYSATVFDVHLNIDSGGLIVLKTEPVAWMGNTQPVFITVHIQASDVILFADTKHDDHVSVAGIIEEFDMNNIERFGFAHPRRTIDLKTATITPEK